MVKVLYIINNGYVVADSTGTMIPAGLGHDPGHAIKMACWISDEGAEDPQQSDSCLHLFLDTTA